ncbi:MAG: hypothetical protein QM702_00240 [Rubrivivax sp.]
MGRPRAFYRELRDRLTQRAKLTVRLGVLQGDGAPLLTHLQRYRRSTGKVDPDLAELARPLPACVAHLYDAYLELAATRRGNTISMVEISAWQALRGVCLTPWELDMLLELNVAVAAAEASARTQTHKDLTS